MTSALIETHYWLPAQLKTEKELKRMTLSHFLYEGLNVTMVKQFLYKNHKYILIHC